MAADKRIGGGIACVVAVGAAAGAAVAVAILHITPAVAGVLIGIVIGTATARRARSVPPCGTEKNSSVASPTGWPEPRN